MSPCPPPPDVAYPTVVVTGLGMVSALGLSATEHSLSFQQHRQSFRPVQRFDVSQRISQTAALVELPPERLFTHLTVRQEARVDHGTKLCLLAMREALSQAALPSMSHVGSMVLGTSAAAMELGERFVRQRLSAQRQGQLTLVEHYQPQRQMATLAREIGWEIGRILLVSNACASGANAIGMGLESLRTGRCQCVVVGGYDSVSELVFSGFDALRALAPSGIPRPFDAQRDGLALGEGAAVLVLETAQHATARGATALATLSGYHTVTDLHHLTQPDPTGAAALRAMRGACTMAQLQPAQVGYINSHGTGTPFNDVAEGAAIQTWAGADVGSISVSSTKSAMGHLLGGAGAIEAAICVQALTSGYLPASLNVREKDPIVTFDLVQQYRSAPQLRHALTNSFGFGGTNATLLFSRI